jgi:4-amino-4-deoxy-L-arabinose transferase-like glycosyltransferase
MAELRIPDPGHARDGEADARAAILLTAALTLARLIALFRTPLELYPDEAQYWLWSRTLAFGYYSKPPIIAWAIRASTAFGGDAEPWVRLPAVLFQGGAALLVFWIARRLYGSRTALAATAIYALTPAIQLSATVVATDAPLLFFIGLTICAYVALQSAEGRLRLALAAGVGAALGLAFLSKYAAVYALIGIGLHLALSPAARRRWTAASIGLAAGVFLAVLTPNIAWNAAHGFATIQHTAADAHWSGRQLFNPGELGTFLLTQFAAFGPIPFAVLIVGSGLLAYRRRLETPDILLLCFTLPPIALVAVQAFVSRANANWSGASYLPGAILVAAWLMRWRTRRLLVAALAIQAVIAAGFFALVLQPRFADSLGQANSLKRARGWSQTAEAIVRKVRLEQPAGLTAIVVNNRFLYSSLAYYGRDYFREPLAAPLKIWLRGTSAGNQAEASAPLTPASGQRVLAVAYEGWFSTEMAADFTRVSDPEIDDVWLDRKHQRQLEMFVGESFRPKPRNPATGHQVPEWEPGDAVKATPPATPPTQP